MLTIKNKTNATLVYPIHEPYNINKIIFFDIETTGFSAKTSYVYLIGCMYYEERNWYIVQWLLNNPSKEKDLLIVLSNKLKYYKRIIHYNGSRFDLPYLIEKYKQYNLEEPFSSLDSFDLYTQVGPYRKLMPFPNLKLQTLEHYLGYNRKDNHSGGELIDVYSKYIGRWQYEKLVKQNTLSTRSQEPHDNNNSSSKELADILLLHNYDDIVGLLDTSSILTYTSLLDKLIKYKDILNYNTNIIGNKLIVNIHFANVFPFSIKWTSPFNTTTKTDKNANNKFLINIKENKINIKTPIINGKLKYFFENYKDYYYLPREDIALHKSVATYVDKEYRIQANQFNCYTHLEGTFIPIGLSDIYKEKNIKLFKDNYKSKINYIELATIINSKENITIWINSLISLIKENKNYIKVTLN